MPFTQDGKTVELSVGQANNRKSHPDRGVRKRSFEGVQAAWAKAAPVLADALNHKAGFRLGLYRFRGWSDVLQELLEKNRMSRASLEAMWDVVDRNKDIFGACLQRKAQILGLERLCVYDVWAPLGGVGRKATYEDAAGSIIANFGHSSPDMGEFARGAFTDRWIEAEDRPGKRPGGFCTPFPYSQQSRLLSAFDGNPVQVGIIAHELGHAYHDHATAGMPHMLLHFPDSLAETASILAERIMLDSAVRNTADPQERVALLDDKITRSVSRFMNMRAKFLLERRFYDARQRGSLTVKDLKRLTVEAQQEAYGNALAEYDPYVWAGTLRGSSYS